MLKKLSKIYSIKSLGIISFVIMLCSLVPPIYVGLFNYATGDDLLYGAVLKNAARQHMSFGQKVGLVMQDVVDEYKTFQGTWSSQILWRLEPSIWGERVYVITIFMSVGILAIGLGYVLKVVLKDYMKLSVWGWLFSFSWVLFFVMQYMPYPRGGLYWYTGMVQYTFAFGISMLALGWGFKFLMTGHKGYLIGCAVAFAYIGGAGFPVIVEAGMILFFVTVWVLFENKGEKHKRALYLLIPLALLAIGFMVSALAPGNSVRGGEDYGLSLGRVLHVLGKSISDGVTYSIDYALFSRSLVFLPIALALVSASSDIIRVIPLKKAVIAAALGFLVVCYVHSPEIFAGDTVAAGISGGVYDIYYYVLVLFLAMCGVLVGSLIKGKIRKSHLELIRICFFAGLLIFVLLFRNHLVGSTLDYKCIQYVRSGQLKDFNSQMKERLLILEDDSIKEVVLPQMNDEQGPIMHMPITSDPMEYTNRATAKFYNKTSVSSMDRNEWNSKHGK